MSLNAFAVRELSEVTRRVRNAELLADLPDLGFTGDEIVVAIHERRAGR